MSTATELMRRALHAWEHGRMLRDMDDAMVEIRTFFDAEPEADEPTDILTIAYQLGYQEGKKFRPEPAIRKPMTKDEISRGFYSGRWLYEDFEAGIRYAEKHHGIGGDDNG